MNLWLDRFNRAPEGEAVVELLGCCASDAWARAVVAARPYGSLADLLETADRLWWGLPAAAWEQAFAAHPRIGEAAAAQPQHGRGDVWSSQEQQGALQADAGTRAELAEINRAYEQRFGRVYIVCASGLSAAELLERARARMTNDPQTELRAAAGEQARIMRLRIEKLYGPQEAAGA